MPASVQTARAIVAGLVAGGVAHACLCPGSRSSPLIAAFAPYETVGVALTVHHDERSAAFFALGVARATRRPVALVCTSGSAPAHFLPAVIEAHHSDLPLVLLTADRPPELRDVGAPQATHQHRLFDGFTRWMVDTATSPLTPSRLLWLERAGFRAATESCSPRPGPVHLNIPFDEPLLPELNEPTPAVVRPGPPANPPQVRPDTAQVADLARRLAAAKFPLVIAGYADFTAAERTAIKALAETLGAPLLADPTANFTDGGSIRHYDVFLRSQRAIDRLPCDAVIRFGAPPVSKSLGRFIAARRPPLHIVVDPHGEWQEPLSIDSTFIRASFLATAADVFDATKTIESKRTENRTAWTTLNTHSAAMIREAISESSAPGHARASAALSAQLRDGDHVHVASSLPIRDFDVFARIESKATLSCNRGVNGIDGTFSTALGLAHARTAHDGRTWALVGDVAALHDIGGLLAASQHRVDATLVVVNNDGGAIFGLLPVARHGDIFERFFSTPHGRTFEGTAALFGLQYHRVDVLDDLPSILQQSRHHRGVVLIEVIVDRLADAESFRVLRARFASELDHLTPEAV